MDLGSISLLFKNRNILYNFMKETNEGLLLDPLSTVIRICLLNFKKENTKISICDNTIYYQEPSMIQGILRWQNGDKRSDLHNLLNPMLLSKLWYKDNSEVKSLYKFAISGLKKIKESYKNNGEETCHALSHYITILLVDDNELEKLLETINYDNVIYEKLKDLWDKKEINILFLLFNILYDLDTQEDKNNILIDSYINSIESILNGKDIIIRDIISNIVKGKI